MKLKRIELDGFGKLVEQAYEFNPGLNLIYGRNEAGKSTLQRSILAALYGFFDDGTITAAKKAVMATFLPWDEHASFGLKLTFELDSGMQYRIERAFVPKAEATLYDLKSGKNVSTRFKSSSQGRLFFAEEMLGMPREVFENTSLVRQAELVALEKSASGITDTLLRLSASASQESTASQALELLETTLKDHIGTQRSRNKPLPEAQRRLEDLHTARARLLGEHQALVNQMHELAQVEESFHKLQRERDKAEYQRLLAKRQVVQQQRQTIGEADAEVERCQKAITQYETWSKFPADAQPKIQRLVAQHEKAQSDANQSAQTARRSEQRLKPLEAQIDSLHKSLKITQAPHDFPDLDAQPAAVTSATLQNWLDTEFSALGKAIQEQQADMTQRTQNLASLIRIGHEGIAMKRQELGGLEGDLIQSKKEVQQLQQAANKVGLPEDQWKKILSDAQADVTGRQEWSNYPADLRDELLQLTAQYTPLQHNLASKSEQIFASQNELAQLQTRVEALQKRITSLENFRGIPQQERPRIQEISSQLEAAQRSVLETHRQFTDIDPIYQAEHQAFDLERKAIEPLEQLGITGLTQLQQRWLNATHQLASAQARFIQSQEAWNRVGMPVAEYQRLENTVKDIQSGVREAPKPRSGCRSLFMPKQTGVVDQIPTEVTIYSQVQPIYTDFSHQRDEITKSQNAVRMAEAELRQSLGQLVPDVIDENTFTGSLQRLQNSQQRALQIEQRKGIWEARCDQYQEAENRMQKIQTRLVGELQKFGFVEPNIHDALSQFFIACDQKEQLVASEATLERIENQVALLNKQLQQFQTQQESLAEVEGRIINLLEKAGIQSGQDGLQEGLKRFEVGLKNHQQWKEAQSRLERTEGQIKEFREQLAKARSASEVKEKSLLNSRKQLVLDFSGHIPDDFTDQYLARLDSDLQAYHAAQAGIEKTQVQFEQLQLQAQAIQRDLNDWVDKEEISKRLENEILQVIHSAGIETDQTTLDEAIHRYEEAFQGYSRWKQAQRDLGVAVQAQQAVRTSLPKIDTELAGLQTKITQLVKQYPEWKSLKVSYDPEVYDRILQKLIDQVTQERDRLMRLQDAVSRGTRNLRHLAELDEEIDMVNAEVQKLSRFGQALELAANELATATREFQKMFAPRLERIIESGLEQITARRYRQVNIDPNSLNVRVLAPEINKMVPTEHLSTGTRDLVYLILRMGITQLMSNSGEKLPLLLDDPFVEFDSLRQRAALEYLGSISNQTQILLFTKDDDVVNWVKEYSSSNIPGSIIVLR